MDRQYPADDDGLDPEELRYLWWEEELELQGDYVLNFVGAELRSGPFEVQLGTLIEWDDSGSDPTHGDFFEVTEPPTMEAILLLEKDRSCVSPSAETKAKWRQIAVSLCSTGALEDPSGAAFSSEEEELLTILFVSQHLWRRPLSCWKKPAGTRLEVLIDLAKYLLERYPVPAWLDAWTIFMRNSKMVQYGHIDHAWYHNADASSAPWVAYIAATQGVKLGPALQYCARKWRLEVPISAARFAFEVPPLMDVEKAFLWLLVRAMGGSRETASRFSLNYWNRCDGWTLPLIRFAVRHPEIVDHLDSIQEWVLHEDIEARRVNPEVRFQLAGRSPARVVAAATAYWFSLHYKQASQHSWKTHGWNARLEEAGVSWGFVELLDGCSLSEESLRLRHCVDTYAEACAQNQSAIVSVRLAGRRVLTVEVEPATGRIVQVHGFANRNATDAEARMVERWAAQFKLVYDPANFRMC